MLECMKEVFLALGLPENSRRQTHSEKEYDCDSASEMTTNLGRTSSDTVPHEHIFKHTEIDSSARCSLSYQYYKLTQKLFPPGGRRNIISETGDCQASAADVSVAHDVSG
jgi:hypothetical protein